MARQAWIVNAFTANENGGNPAGVVFDDGTIPPHRKLEIARTLGASETAFVSPAGSRTLQFEFWTPARQILDCGHATLGGLGAWAQLKGLSQGSWTKRLIDGSTRELEVMGSRFASSQPRATFRTEQGLTVGDQGVRFALIELPNTDALHQYDPNVEVIQKISEELDLIGFYLYVRTPGLQSAATTRMFAPRFGIPEESATGMAAGILGSLLTLERPDDPLDLMIEQGVHMPNPSPSMLHLRTEARKIWVGGTTEIQRGVWLD